MSENILDEIFNPENLLKAISKYRLVDLKKISLFDTITLFQSFFRTLSLSIMHLGNCKLYRVRKIDNGDIHDIQSKVWCPSSKYVTKMGRFNDIAESFFYSALDPVTAIKEAKIKPGELFSLCMFNLKKNDNSSYSTVNIVPRTNIPDVSKNQEICSMILTDFAFVEATRPVAEGTEYQYISSCAISKILLETPSKDSLCYPSMIDSTRLNFGMTEMAARNRIKLIEVHKCMLHDYNNDFDPIISDYEVAYAKMDTDILIYKPFHPDAREFVLSNEKFFQSNDLVKQIKENINFSIDNRLEYFSFNT